MRALSAADGGVGPRLESAFPGHNDGGDLCGPDAGNDLDPAVVSGDAEARPDLQSRHAHGAAGLAASAGGAGSRHRFAISLARAWTRLASRSAAGGRGGHVIHGTVRGHAMAFFK